ncbi:UDP-glycosyltransferase UGT5-like isoform X1 [Tribolium castaneum]|uniref:UDP-glycosyltransferase UGT5-like isoform X1 n=1 Tax=Tribolium castaneum TaxID=7070 RepID=UPI0030FE9BE5
MYLKTLVFCALLSLCNGYKILAVFPTPFHSHCTLASKLVTELAKRGHEVTYLSPFPKKTQTKNLREISLESIIPVINERKKQLLSLNDHSVFHTVHFLTNMGYAVTEEFYRNENVQKLLKSQEHFDLIILAQFVNEGLVGLAHHFNAPFVLMSSMPLFAWSKFFLTHPAPSSYVPNLLTPYSGHMNFWQRLCNSIYDVYSILYHQWVILPKHNQVIKKHIRGEPDVHNLLNNASLLLVNSHVSANEPTVQIPNVVEMGGMHLEEPKKLPEDLQKFLDGSKDGVIVFSMGSNLKSSDLPRDKRDAILRAFSKLKQNVLWKWEEEELPGQPKNVKLMKWMPQTDILAHPNVKAFVTHGGLLSTMESIYRGVPTIGIPIFSDQKTNMEIAVSYGYALLLPLQELTEEKLSSALDEILSNPKYRENVLKRSKIMKDRPIKPLDNAIYWIEYVIRHQGAPHLRYPGMDLNWFQRNLLDVGAFATIALLLILALIRLIVKLIFNKKVTKEKIN